MDSLKVRYENEIKVLKNIISTLNEIYSCNEEQIKLSRIEIQKLHKVALDNTLLENHNKEIKNKIELFHKTIYALNEILLMDNNNV
jgi:hypothetical protein